MYHLNKIDKIHKNMKKQKICIIGDGLSGLTAALVLSGLKIDVDLISSNKSFKNHPDHRVTAISQSNYKFLYMVHFYQIH